MGAMGDGDFDQGDARDPRKAGGPADLQGLAKMLNGVGWMHAQLGDYEQALECAMRIARHLHDTK